MNQDGTTQKRDLPYEISEGLGARAHIGFIVLSNDQTLSYEARQMLTLPGIAVYEARQKLKSIPQGDRELTSEALQDLRDSGITDAADRINDRRQPDVVAYGCTSGAMVVGHAALQSLIQEVLPDSLVTDPLTAALAALRALGAKRVALINPYSQALSEQMAETLKHQGYVVPVCGRFHVEGKNQSVDAPFITPESIETAVLSIGADDEIDTVFVSCTQMRFAEKIGEAEQKLGKPVITSNQALCWHSLRLAGCADKPDGFGRLFQTSLAGQ